MLVRETVTYAPTNPWPARADGGGASLQRIDPAAFADDPINWYPATPTPGAAGALAADADADGAPDWAEWIGGTDPSNALSRFELRAVSNADEGVSLLWPSAAGKGYCVERATNLLDGAAFVPWAEGVPAQGTWTRWDATNAPAGEAWHYRVRVTRP